MDDPASMEVFFDVFAGLPREAPGLDECTRQALALCKGLPEHPVVLDLGCGPGAQTMVLATELAGTITAVDFHEPFLEELRRRAEALGITDRVETRRLDMTSLPFEPESFDSIWAEGSAYIVGIEAALRAWKPLLKPGGYLGFTELVWLVEEPDAEVKAFFDEEYPAMTSVKGNLDLITNEGYAVVGRFTLPNAAWWDHYYGPLEAKFPMLRERYAGNEPALAIVAQVEREVAMRRRHPDDYGYEFFVARKGI